MSLASLRHAFRALLVRPSLTLAAVATIGLAVGAATAIYSAVQAVLLAPLPFADPDRLVMVWEQDVRKNARVIELSHREFEAFRDRSEVFESVADRLPDAKHLFTVDDGAVAELIKLGRQIPQSEVDARIAEFRADFTDLSLRQVDTGPPRR